MLITDKLYRTDRAETWTIIKLKFWKLATYKFEVIRLVRFVEKYNYEDWKTWISAFTTAQSRCNFYGQIVLIEKYANQIFNSIHLQIQHWNTPWPNISHFCSKFASSIIWKYLLFYMPIFAFGNSFWSGGYWTDWAEIDMVCKYSSFWKCVIQVSIQSVGWFL